MKITLVAIAVLGVAPLAWAQDDPPAADSAPDLRAEGERAAGEQPASLTDERFGKFEGFYLRAGFGLVGFADSDYRAGNGAEREVEFDIGYGGSTAFGYDFGSVFQPGAPGNRLTINLRAEVEFSFERVDADDEGGPGPPRLDNLWTRGGAINGYVDFDTSTRWTFYTGLGVGAAQVGADGAGFDDRDTSGFVQLMAGAIFDVTSRASLYAGLRSRGYQDIDIEDAELEDLASGSLEVGLIFSF